MNWDWRMSGHSHMKIFSLVAEVIEYLAGEGGVSDLVDKPILRNMSVLFYFSSFIAETILPCPEILRNNSVFSKL